MRIVNRLVVNRQFVKLNPPSNLLETIIIQADIYSLIESLDYGIPHPLWTYHYLLQLIYNFYGQIFIYNFQYDNPCIFHFYAHVVDAPTHPALLYCKSSISNVIL